MNKEYEPKIQDAEEALADAAAAKKHALPIKTTLVLSLVIILAAVGVMLGLKLLKKAPERKEPTEQALLVNAITVQPEDAVPFLEGYGEVRVKNVVTVMPEVSGLVVSIHPRLNVGEVIPAGEVLFEIDARDYTARALEAEASVTQLTTSLERLKKQFSLDTDRLKTLERSRQLAQAELKRVRDLYEKDQVGTRSGVDQAEQTANLAIDAADQMKQMVELYPLRIKELEQQLLAAAAMQSMADTNLARTSVAVDFPARIKERSLEVGQLVSPGAPVLTLADDSKLEISIPLDSREARRWLQFEERSASDSTAWFGDVVPVACPIVWTEEPNGAIWTGILDRVAQFNQDTRTLSVVVRISGEQASGKGGMLPLVEGMFCHVRIPGRLMTNVYRLPRGAVSFVEGTVHVIQDSRLITLPITLVHDEGEDAFVSGLAPGAQVITTRLINPPERALVKVQQVEDMTAGDLPAATASAEENAS